MSILYLTYALNALLMVAMPLVLGIFLARRLGTRWSLFGIGAITFIASQVVHIPLNIGLTALFAQGILPQPPEAWGAWFNPVILGLTAGLCEEIARFLVLRFWLKSARTWREALMFGAGHGGIEAILVGVTVAVAFISFIYLQRGGLDVIPAEQRELVAQQLAAYWAAPWYATLLGAVERLFAICVHLLLAVLVMQAVARRNPLWLVAAVLWHAALNATALIVLQPFGPYWTEVVIGGFAVVSLGIIFALRPPPEAPAAPPPPFPPAPAPLAPIPSAGPATPEAEAELRRRMDDTRYDAPRS